MTLKIYPQARHEVFNEAIRDQVVDDLVTWLDQELGPRQFHQRRLPVREVITK
ncbi:MAG TPA: hypothetical protein VLW50_17305 [Streptosporangiaceae bacterium]|nr:hypothetical protein [Streptosporangiaceae bacterium]